MDFGEPGMKKTAVRVLIPESGSLLDEGLKSLLRRDGNLQIETVAFKDKALFFQDVARLCPEVIVWNEIGPLETIQWCELIDVIPQLMNLRVIVIHPDDNAIDVYEKQHVTATQISDLIAIIKRQQARV